MASNWPVFPTETSGGDDPTHSPQKTQNSLLGAERGAQRTKRLETDSDNNLYVHVAADDIAAGLPVSALANGSITSVSDSTLTTIVTYTTTAPTKVTRISCSGTIYAKFQLFLNTTLIETRRSGPDRTLDFNFEDPWSLATSDIVDVKVTHYQTGVSADFESTLYGA
jgi:hypothetical protein